MIPNNNKFDALLFSTKVKTSAVIHAGTLKAIGLKENWNCECYS